MLELLFAPLCRFAHRRGRVPSARLPENREMDFLPTISEHNRGVTR